MVLATPCGMKTDPLAVLRPLRLRVWLTRLGGLDEDRFNELATVIRRMSRINLAELTPLLNPVSTIACHLAVQYSHLGVFLKQIGGKGTVFLEFVDDERVEELADFQDFQLYYRVLAAIGLGSYSTRLGDHESFQSAITKVVSATSPYLIF